MKLPFQIYDFISILFPGIITLCILKYEFPLLDLWKNDNNISQLVIYFVLSYIIGHLLQEIGRYKKVSNYLKNVKQTGQDNPNNIKGRHYDLPISEPLAKEINTAFLDLYGIEAKNIKNEEVFGLVFSTIQDRITQRSIFVSIANLYRAIIVISMFYFVLLTIKSFYYIFNPKLELYIDKTLLIFIVTFGVISVSKKGLNYFKKLSDQVPYYAFLSWYKETKFSQKKDI
ncbi:hypothetical protein N752_29500 [Desulforamulus aquiferis]|nr:hypothetical protein [Desulforamulus aquiferis]RYD01714.1 hypothetical protein N752_29500 [Desulforamulus aquiferis]